jgi:hypothetical protein
MTYIHGHIPGNTTGHPDQFPLGAGRQLIVKPADDTPLRIGMIVLDKLTVDSIGGKIGLFIRLQKITTIIFKYPGLDQYRPGYLKRPEHKWHIIFLLLKPG